MINKNKVSFQDTKNKNRFLGKKKKEKIKKINFFFKKKNTKKKKP